MEKSNARNHHYVSQVEQRLNAIDMSARPENQRIHKFEVVDSENLLVKNIAEQGVKIEKNLAVQDLYALKMLDGGGQHNLENAFQTYEDDIGVITKSLISKLSDPQSIDFQSEIIRLYLLKFLNSFRNPHAIKKTLHVLRSLKGVVPGNVELRDHFATIDQGLRKQARRVSAEFGVTEDEYVEWLKAIYLIILQPLEGGLNLLEHLVKGLVENPDYVKDITVHLYAGEHKDAGVLICDQGMVEGNVDDGVLVQMFNLDANAFVSFMFIDLKNQGVVKIPPEYLEGLDRLTKRTKVHTPVNNMEMLAAYNRHCVWQAAASVYCATPLIHGIEVVR